MGGEEVEKSSILTLLYSLLFGHGNPMIRLSYLLLLIAGITTSLPAVQRPNIVLVFIDDMGWGDFSCFGNTEANTPHKHIHDLFGIVVSTFWKMGKFESKINQKPLKIKPNQAQNLPTFRSNGYQSACKFSA